MKKSRFRKLLVISLIIFTIMRFAPLFAPNNSLSATGKNYDIDRLIAYQDINSVFILRALKDKNSVSYLVFAFLLFIISRNLISRLYVFVRNKQYIADIRVYFKRFNIMHFNGSKYKDVPSFSVLIL